MRYIAYTAFVVVSFALVATQALAQQRNGSSTSNMSQGIDNHGHVGMDMQTMANQCTQMRNQMKQNPSAPVSDDMRKMMVQCDQMDKMMRDQHSGSGMGQTK